MHSIADDAVLSFILVAQIRAPQATGPALPAPRPSRRIPNLGPTETNKATGFQSNIRTTLRCLWDAKEIPYQRGQKALSDYRKLTASKFDPQGICLPPAGSRLMDHALPHGNSSDACNKNES
jgi:hypothetical protein